MLLIIIGMILAFLISKQINKFKPDVNQQINAMGVRG